MTVCDSSAFNDMTNWYVFHAAVIRKQLGDNVISC